MRYTVVSHNIFNIKSGYSRVSTSCVLGCFTLYDLLSSRHSSGTISLLIQIHHFEENIVFQGTNYLNIALVLQEGCLTIFTRPANTCTCPLKVYAIKNIRE